MPDTYFKESESESLCCYSRGVACFPSILKSNSVSTQQKNWGVRSSKRTGVYYYQLIKQGLI
uniref:Uncharacterized protein n=1 Tax=Arundo donax TaxID=35708 RepID=A0A0A9G8H3_ARUDO